MAGNPANAHDCTVHALDGVITASGAFYAFRECAGCGEPNVRPPVAYSVLLDDERRARGMTIAGLARQVGLSETYVARQLDADQIVTRPSYTAARRLADALELRGDARRAVIQSARAGVGLDLKVNS